MNRAALRTLVLAAILACSAMDVLGQATGGDVVGSVRDSSGALIANATIEAVNLQTGYKTSTTTNSTGEYHFVNLAAGHYSLRASAAGLAGGYSDIEVQLNFTATANITASVSGNVTNVEVTGQFATLDTTTPTISNTFEGKQAADLPITSTGGLVLNLALLDAGIAMSGGIGAGFGPSVSGQRPRNNNFTIEGVDNNSNYSTGPGTPIPNDAVDNFTVLQNQFSPEFGHSSGAQFNQSIKSGTNTWHGALYEYFQNRHLNAIDSQTALSEISNNEKPFNPRFDNNRFGGQLGGPIIKDKLFFFADSEYNPIGLSGTASTACAPTAAGYAMLNALFPNAKTLPALQKYLPAAASQATSPSDICWGYNGGGVSQVVPGVPSYMWNNSVSFTSIPIGDVGFSGSSYNNTLITVNSMDWNISEKDLLHGRMIWSKYSAVDTSSELPVFWDNYHQPAWVVALSEYHIISAKLSNEFRVGFNHFADIYPLNPATYPGLTVFPKLVFYELNGLQIGPNQPSRTIQSLYQLIDNVSWAKGRHNLKWGGEYRWSISPISFTQRIFGDYEWTYLSDYLNDFAPNPNVGDFAERSNGNPIYYGNRKSIYGFVNDIWRLTPNLAVNYGVRYEWNSEPLAATSLQPLNASSNVPELVTFGAPTTQKANFMPRLGIAYSPESNTAIRAGFAMANDVLFDNLFILALPPQVQQTCDTQAPGAGGQSASCYWSYTNFLANGGLPQNPTPITDPAVARAATSGYIPNQKLPYSETWTLGVQHLFARQYKLEVRYVGTRGIDLPVQTRLNKATPVAPNSYLPTYLTAPPQATLDSLPLTLSGLQANNSSYLPNWYAAGFTGNLVAFEPWGGSKYTGLQTQFNRAFNNGLQFQLAWTWSHLFDNSTAEIFTTVLTPRRPQNFQCFQCDWSTSAYDRRHRITLEAMYQLPFFKFSNALVKNMLGNWQVVPIYTFESPEYATCQSGVDSNLNGDSVADRCILNPIGVPGTSSTVTPLMNSSGQTVAYLAANPSAQYIQAGPGALANAPRNTIALPHTNNWDLSLLKNVRVTERQLLQFQLQVLNLFNHPQYVPGYISDVSGFAYTSAQVRQILIPGSATFDEPQAVFSNHPRNVALVLKYLF